MNHSPDKMRGKAKVCGYCFGEGTVEVKRQEFVLDGFLGGMRLPCPRCNMLGYVEESEIDCEAKRGSW